MDWWKEVMEESTTTMKCPKCGQTDKGFRNSWHNTDSGQGLVCISCGAYCEWSSAFDPPRLSSNPFNTQGPFEVNTYTKVQ